MKSIISHISHNTLDDFAQLFKIMFTDSTIATVYDLGENDRIYGKLWSRSLLKK